MKKNNGYKIGDTVVHLSHGIGKIASLETREFTAGKPMQFFVVEIVDNGAPKKVFVPVEAATERLRRIISKADAKRIIAILNGKAPAEPIDSQTWSRRYREYMERIHSGDAEAIATVIVALRSLSESKDLSFGERKLLDQATSLIRAELSAVNGLDVVFL